MWDYYINFNQRFDPALQDPVVKKAIAYAIDKDRLVEIARLGYGTVTETYIPSAFFGPAYENPDATTYEYNVFLANQLLDAAGYLDIDADGIREMPSEMPTEEEEYALQSDLDSLITELESMNTRLNNSLNMAYGLGIVALLIAIVAVYYAMRS